MYFLILKIRMLKNTLWFQYLHLPEVVKAIQLLIKTIVAGCGRRSVSKWLKNGKLNGCLSSPYAVRGDGFALCFLTVKIVSPLCIMALCTL